MTISISIPMNWARSVAKGKYLFEVDGSTLDECLRNLNEMLPGIKKHLYYGDGKTFQTAVKILLNNKPFNIEAPLLKLVSCDFFCGNMEVPIPIFSFNKHIFLL